MSNVVGTRLDNNYLQQLKNYAKKKSWTPSQAIREIVTLFFSKENNKKAA